MMKSFGYLLIIGAILLAALLAFVFLGDEKADNMPEVPTADLPMSQEEKGSAKKVDQKADMRPAKPNDPDDVKEDKVVTPKADNEQTKQKALIEEKKQDEARQSEKQAIKKDEPPSKDDRAHQTMTNSVEEEKNAQGNGQAKPAENKEVANTNKKQAIKKDEPPSKDDRAHQTMTNSVEEEKNAQGNGQAKPAENKEVANTNKSKPEVQAKDAGQVPTENEQKVRAKDELAKAEAIKAEEKPEVQVPPLLIDIVRLDNDGNLLLAGRGASDADIELQLNGSLFGQFSADGQGNFLFERSDVQASGILLFYLQDSLGRAAQVVVKRDATGKAIERIIAVDDEGPKTIVGEVQKDESQEIDVFAIAANEDGVEVIGSGGDDLKLTINGEEQNVTVRRSEGGDWRAIVKKQLPEGEHELQVACAQDCGGTNTSRFLVGNNVGKDQSVVTVQRGNHLWGFAKRFYGEGILYTLIHEANRDRINDPNLIFPGQVFTVPDQ